jgi:hypothetical protein
LRDGKFPRRVDADSMVVMSMLRLVRSKRILLRIALAVLLVTGLDKFILVAGNENPHDLSHFSREMRARWKHTFIVLVFFVNETPAYECLCDVLILVIVSKLLLCPKFRGATAS